MTKVVFNFGDGPLQDLKDLQIRGGFDSPADVINRALNLLSVVYDVENRGFTDLQAHNPETRQYRRIEMKPRSGKGLFQKIIQRRSQDD
jgi:hypothetical protein